MLQACKTFYDTERRHVYTTPKTFLELIKLYKSTLARKRKESQEAIDRYSQECSNFKTTCSVASCRLHGMLAYDCIVSKLWSSVAAGWRMV